VHDSLTRHLCLIHCPDTPLLGSGEPVFFLHRVQTHLLQNQLHQSCCPRVTTHPSRELPSRPPPQWHILLVGATKITQRQSAFFSVLALDLQIEPPRPASTHMAASRPTTRSSHYSSQTPGRKEDDGNRPSRLLNLNKSRKTQKLLYVLFFSGRVYVADTVVVRLPTLPTRRCSGCRQRYVVLSTTSRLAAVSSTPTFHTRVIF
jgi:hypothetical protein